MIDRILDFSERPTRLRVRYAQLVVEQAERESRSLPLSEIAVLIAAHPQVSYTQAVLSGLAESGGTFVACNDKHLPVGMFLPLTGHHAQSQRFIAQAEAPLPTKKRLWKQVVQAKIVAQAQTLETLHGTDHGLRVLAAQVRSGDPTNVEAQAARRYWSRLFVDSRFRRNPDDEDHNLLLNYGYAVLRAIVARAICGAGLHPCLGLHHHHRSNPFCLADDLMEPFRPVVDLAVAEYIQEQVVVQQLEASAKRAMIASLTGRYLLAGEQRTLFDTAAGVATSLAEVFLGERRRLVLPEGPIHAAP